MVSGTPHLQLVHSMFLQLPFRKPALSATIASPIGYEALKYLSYPLMMLTKSSKPVPVMAVGFFFYGRKYGWHKYMSVLLLCIGIYMFTNGKSSSAKHESNTDDVSRLLFGIFLVLLNLSLDGYTNNEQDRIFTKYASSPNHMMKGVNLMQCIYQFVYLVVGWFMYAGESELVLSVTAMQGSLRLCGDILAFCVCASVGQVLIFNVMQEFGSLTWITISVTRKLFTIVLSVVIFQHKVNTFQWMGVALVFVGLGVDAYISMQSKSKADSGSESSAKNVSVEKKKK
jgi:solute carrier family 35 (UDP-galactose transporter), member B1